MEQNFNNVFKNCELKTKDDIERLSIQRRRHKTRVASMRLSIGRIDHVMDALAKFNPAINFLNNAEKIDYGFVLIDELLSNIISGYKTADTILNERLEQMQNQTQNHQAQNQNNHYVQNDNQANYDNQNNHGQNYERNENNNGYLNSPFS